MNARSAGSQAQSLRSMNMNNTYGNPQNSRQAPRLQNTQKTGLGNGNAGAGWAFGAPSGSAFGSLGGAPGLGQARPGQLSGFAQVMGGGSGQGPIDMSDFPSLAGGPRQAPNNNNWGGNNSAVRQPPIQQQAPSQPRAPSTAPSHQSIEQFDGQRSQPQSTDRGSGDDYGMPSNLNGNGNGMTQTNGLASSVGSPEDIHPQPNGQQSQQLPSRDASYSSMPQAPIGSNIPSASPASLPSQSDNAQPSQASSNVKKWGDMTQQERLGLPGWIAVMEAARAMAAGQPVDPTLPAVQRNTAMLTVGQDINSLGMNLESTEPLHKNFHVFPDMTSGGGSYDSSRRNPVPDHAVPPAYYVSNVPDSATRMAAFSDDTLFLIFYTEVRDVKQELAAIELANRDWRWHKVLRQWIQKDCGPGVLVNGYDHTNGAPANIQPVRLSEKVERGIYIFFNQNEWCRERKEFTLDYDCLYDQRLAPMPVQGIVQQGPSNVQ
ncbi:hypothetical protein DOTSEDRAFT_71664 [Dothistroma septosporum NZE10]|uniref:NOT2/NOT3/NOT5 C-terminal domain-containing protein n=1 Tax=Dothistroma septosporum (strain NZE10 / CBS 128990) TaxID=675120 RepID=N1PKQ1_DOTSN|nr:hypothetical protein DOTSEDRAFT_71664 [Dothistroma septosporum NZE10]